MSMVSSGTQRYRLGRQSLSRIGFGATQPPGPGEVGPPRDPDEAIAVLRAAEHGVVRARLGWMPARVALAWLPLRPTCC
jgi:hypothetical protein